MKVSKVIDRLVAFAPPVLAAATRMPEHCVLATMTACDVLAAFDIPAEPCSVRVTIANRRYIEGLTRGLAPASIVATGGHLIDTGADGQTLVTDRGRMWHGHLVAWLPGPRLIVDLVVGAWTRPAKAIRFPAAHALAFTPPAQEYPRGGPGTVIRYEVVRPDPGGWRDAHDATTDRRDLVRPIVQAIRRGSLTRRAG